MLCKRRWIGTSRRGDNRSGRGKMRGSAGAARQWTRAVLLRCDDGEQAATRLDFLLPNFAKHHGVSTTKRADGHEDFYPRIHPLHPALLEAAFGAGLPEGSGGRAFEWRMPSVENLRFPLLRRGAQRIESGTTAEGFVECLAEMAHARITHFQRGLGDVEPA